jgi:type I restriction-modification system DNA methylase subunit
VGKPEFIITFKKDNPDYIIVIECKSDVTKHESKIKDNYRDYAVDGVLLYSSFISKEYDVLSIAVSGENANNLKISHFLQLKGEKDAKPIFGCKLLSIENYLNGYITNERKFTQQYHELLKYSKNLNDFLHSKKIKESQRSLLISGILIALDDEPFEVGYKKHKDTKNLANSLVTTIKNQLSNTLNADKAENLSLSYSFIKTHPALLKGLIDDIDKNINSFVKTYRYFDVLGQFYIEFLKYANNDKGLGIVLTPPHITEFFSDLAMVNQNSIVLDNCAGTGGFLISAMKKMVFDAKEDEEKIKNIHEKQIVGIEYQDDIFALICSNMYIHGDGKSSIIHGDCFEEKIMEKVKSEYQPNIGFLNPPYRIEKTDPYEFEFILNNISMLQKDGTCIAIVPMSCALAQKGNELDLKRKILEHNTLEAVFSMPNDLFVNSDTGTVTCVMVIKARQPHPKKNYETYFGYCKDDGFIKRKPTGRGDYLNKWSDIKNQWVSNFRNKKEIPGHSIKRCVTAEDEWCVEAYMETDYSKITKEDFTKTVKEFVLFQELFLK